MPKLIKSLPKYRKHRGSGQAVVTIAGGDVYLGPHGTKASHAEYDRVIAVYLATGRRGSAETIKKPLTVNQLILAYWKHAKGDYLKNGEPTSELSAVKTVLSPVRRLYGKQSLKDFGPLALNAIRETWILAGHTRGTINKNVRRIVRAFKWAASEEMIPVEIHQALATVEGLKKGRTNAKESKPTPCGFASTQRPPNWRPPPRSWNATTCVLRSTQPRGCRMQANALRRDAKAFLPKREQGGDEL